MRVSTSSTSEELVERSNRDRVRVGGLGAYLRAVGSGVAMRLRVGTGLRGDELFPTEAEAERTEKERERADKEHERADKERERAARQALEAEIEGLRGEVARLRAARSGKPKRR